MTNLQSGTSFTSIQRTVTRSDRRRAGSDDHYHFLTYGQGEPHLRRSDLAPNAAPRGTGRVLLTFAQITDIHVQDHQSPARFEFVDRLYGPAPLHLLAPSYRPQEFLQIFSCEAMIRTLNALQGGPALGSAIDIALCTGDLTDNCQSNELGWALTLLRGGALSSNSGGYAYEGVLSEAWADYAYWHPESTLDDYKRRWGFPAYEGVLQEALGEMQATGLRYPWHAILGNHDSLIQGTALTTEAMKVIVTGGHKAAALPEGFDILANLDRYIAEPERFLAGPNRDVTADAGRLQFTRSQWVDAVYSAIGEPQSHGLGTRNVSSGTAYFVDDSHQDMRIIFLDTVNAGGNYHGSIGRRQLAWLEERLSEAHSWRLGPKQAREACGGADRLVILVSHHGIDSLVNDMVTLGVEEDVPRVLGAEVEALLHRFPNVVLWVNGHTHRNTVVPRPDQTGATNGFWEVTTSSLLDWPCQARILEVVANEHDTISIFCTMVDHAGLPDHGDSDPVFRLASIHRELAANDPHDGVAAGNGGGAVDRNVELLLHAPFKLSR